MPLILHVTSMASSFEIKRLFIIPIKESRPPDTPQPWTNLDSELLLEVAQDVSEVYVEELSVPHNHDVVGVAVANAQDVRGHTIAGGGGQGHEYFI